MSEEKNLFDQKESQPAEPELPVPWQRIQGALWLIGIAILALTDWWWPGILMLVALSILAQASLQLYFSRKTKSEKIQNEAQQLDVQRAAWLPAVCPACGGPLSVRTVQWTGPATADCPYCSAHIKP
jgi:membrane protein implicated in regulation of membrane protease activity